MFKNTIAAFLFCWTGLVSPAQEIVIEKADVITSGKQATLAINYSGAGRIQFFAVDEVDSLTVDFPGVLSRCDFSTLSCDLVTKVEQTPLDPDSDRGISVKFHLADGVKYQFFDGEKGSVILLFEGANEPGVEKMSASVEPPKEEPAPAIQVEVEPASIVEDSHQANCQILSGRDSLNSLRQVKIVEKQGQYQITASAPAMESYKYFYLTGPDRFVMDFYGVVCNLDQDNLEFDSGVVNRLRVKQFQVHPQPITRMVLDLSGPQEIQINENVSGNMVLSTDNFTQDTGVLSQKGGVEESAVLAENIETEQSGDNSQQVAQVQNAVEEPESSLVVKDDTSNNVVIASGEQNMVQQDVPVVNPEPVETSAVAVEKSTETPVVEMTESSVSLEEPVTEQAITQVEEVLPAKVEEPQEMASQDMASEEEIIPSTESVVENLVPEPKVESAPEPKKTKQLPFLVVDEVDQSLESFINNEKTFYSQMKETRALKPRNNHIKVTNRSISQAMELAESSGLQNEEATQSEFEKSSLFDEVNDDFTSDKIAGGEQTYKGFEIQGIDVVDVNVTDLLRFFADQVGFNLYVDPSVKNLKATYKFSNIPWDQAMDIILRNAGLDYQYDNGVLRVATTQKFKDEAAARRELQMEQELSVPPETVTFRLSYAKAAELAPIVTEYLSPRGSLLQDERTNTLIIEDIPKKMVAIRSLIKKLDTQVPQVTIESRIVETTKRFMRELGIQWGMSGLYAPEYGTQTGVTFPNRVTLGGPVLGSSTNGIQGGYAVNLPIIDDNPSGVGLSLGNVLDTFKLDISLQMLESDGLGQIISAPKVTTQNNKTAIIQNGQKVPVQTIQRGTITVRYINAVLELEVTPHITSEKTIIMDLIVDKSEPDFTREVLGNPIINIRRAETRVLVKDGGTAVIGGIYVLNQQDSSRGIPGLKKVPVLKRLFNNESKEITNQELLIFVTPRIVKY